MSQNILTASEKMSHEYCASVIRVGEIHPLENSDNLEKTLINGNSFVIEKGTLHTGDIAFYVENECEINSQFLSINNQYEISEYSRNSNAAEIEEYLKLGSVHKEIANKKEKQLKKLKEILKKIKDRTTLISAIETLKMNIDENKEKYEQLIKRGETEQLSEDDEKFLDMYKKAVTSLGKKENKLTTYDDVKNCTVEDIQKSIDAIKEEIASENEEYEKIMYPAKRKVGFFNRYGRVKMIRLRGCPSYGYLFGVESMKKFCPDIETVNLEELIGLDFDTVNVNGEDVLFCKAYVPRVKVTKLPSRTERRQKKVAKFNRVIDFDFHYETWKLQKNMQNFNRNDVVDITLKLHGTSWIGANILVKYPKKFHTPFKKLNKWLQKMYLQYVPSKWQSYSVDYGNVCSSRSVIKNKEFNPDVGSGYYKSDVWTEMNNLIKDFIPQGYTLYGEIIGYEIGSERMIQKEYDYGCEKGENKLMIYRITETDPDGKKREFTVSEVYDWTMKLISEHQEIANRIHPIDIIYHGTLEELYPEINCSDSNGRWRDDVLEAMKIDTRFKMEMLEPLCTHYKVPREGIVIRKEVDGYSSEAQEAYKLKTDMFFEREKSMIDSGDVDIEMASNNYGSENIDNEDCEQVVK